jgi:hypothetical protein
VIPLHTQISVSQKVVFQEIGAEAVLVDLQAGYYYGLNSTATNMWRCLVENQSPAAALAVLTAAQVAPPDVLERDLLRLTEDLLKRNLLTIATE